MATMDIFEGDAFSIIGLTRALENIPFKPTTLSASGLFSDRGVRTRTVVIESRDGTPSLIPVSERGSAHDSQVPERRNVRAFVCRQLKKQDVIWAPRSRASVLSAPRARRSRCRSRWRAGSGGCAPTPRQPSSTTS
jgi:Phage major capsid protein E